MKRFAIYDHGVLFPNQLIEPKKSEAFNQVETAAGTTTKKAVDIMIATIKHLGFDPAIILLALKNIPKQDVKNGCFHYITVRWS